MEEYAKKSEGFVKGIGRTIAPVDISHGFYGAIVTTIVLLVIVLIWLRPPWKNAYSTEIIDGKPVRKPLSLTFQWTLIAIVIFIVSTKNLCKLHLSQLKILL